MITCHFRAASFLFHPSIEMREASWSAVAEMPEPSGIGDTAIEQEYGDQVPQNSR